MITTGRNFGVDMDATISRPATKVALFVFSFAGADCGSTHAATRPKRPPALPFQLSGSARLGVNSALQLSISTFGFAQRSNAARSVITILRPWLETPCFPNAIKIPRQILGRHSKLRGQCPLVVAQFDRPLAALTDFRLQDPVGQPFGRRYAVSGFLVHARDRGSARPVRERPPGQTPHLDQTRRATSTRESSEYCAGVSVRADLR